jgi:propionate CoA-transferase
MINNSPLPFPFPQAAHNTGGRVVVQVSRLVPRGALPPRSVAIPAALVDAVVVVDAASPLHAQVIGVPHWDGSLCGEGGEGGTPAPPDTRARVTGVRRVVAHRAMLAIDAPHALINVGVGMPEGVAALVAERGALDIPAALPLTLSTEAGSFGGVPAGGRAFGAAAHPTAQIPMASMLDLYNGGAIDVCVLGAAEVSPSGDVNVSSFPGRSPGCGGFIDISQSARAVVFVGTLTSGGLDARVQGGRLTIVREGRHAKFRRRVQEVTFAAATNPAGRRVLYVTERAVFRLRAEGGGLEVVEVAPGVDLERDVLARMEFRPAVAAGGVKQMDGRCFEG